MAGRLVRDEKKVISTHSKKRASSIDVAELSGVSQTTVSRVLNGKQDIVAEETIKKVQDAVDKLGYSPNMIAKSLSRKFTRIIGIVIVNFEDTLYMKELDLFTQAFNKCDYSVMLFNATCRNGIESSLKVAMEYHVDGLIITSAQIDPSLVRWCVNLGTQIFLFNNVADELNVSSVCCDNYAGGVAVADFLIDKGHRKLIFVSGDLSHASTVSSQREQGFFAGAAKRNVVGINKIKGDYTYASGMDAAKQYIQEYRGADAVFISADPMARGFIDYIETRTPYRIPEDISVIGFDGIFSFEHQIKRFYSYRQPIVKMVNVLVEHMIRAIENSNLSVVNILLPGMIVGGGSVIDRVAGC